ncbi:MAG TPA: PAS domain-containing protein [Bryobacteraceae bacterium]|nr:PAS domain-containing protein [Bryobacteraceae bacterium]
MIERALGADARAHGRNLILLLTLGSIAMAGAVWWYYHRQLTAMEDQVIQELRAVSDNKTKQIATWRAERVGDGEVLLSAPVISIATKILAGGGSPQDTADLAEGLQRFQDAFHYRGEVLADMEGRVRMAIGEPATDAGRLRDLAHEAIAAGDARLSDLRPDPLSGRPLMALVVPVAQKGAMILDIDPERFLYPYLRDWSGRSQSAETLLMRRDGEYAVYLNHLRHRPEGPLQFRRDMTGLGLPPDSTLETARVFRGKDYHGAPVIALLRHVPDSPWFVTVKIDSAEADEPERRLGWEMAIITGLIGLVNLTGAAVILRGRNARIQEEKTAWFYAAANDTPAYIWMADPTLENSFINAPLAKFLGTSKTQLRDTWAEAIHPEDAARSRTTFRAHMKAQEGYTHEYRIKRFDGEYRTVVSKAVPRHSPEGAFLGFAGSILDVTGRRMAERKLREANESLQKLSSRLIGAQEEERKRLARELHDDLSQQIAALSLATGRLKREIPEHCGEARMQADAIHAELVKLAEDVRRISHELHPAVLQYSGLAAALRSYCEEFGASNSLEIALEIDGAFEDLTPDVALCFFRVTQEALRNVVKHARVSSASVTLRRAEGALHLMISDRGAGMDAGAAGGKAGLGLLNIRERARLVGGKAEIRSAPGEGTTVTVEVPEVQSAAASRA